MRSKKTPRRSLESVFAQSKLIKYLHYKAGRSCKNIHGLKRAIASELCQACAEGRRDLAVTERRLEAMWQSAQRRLRTKYAAYGNFHQLPGTRWWFQLGLSTTEHVYVKLYTPKGENMYTTSASVARLPELCDCRAHKIVRGLLCLSAADQLDKCVPGRTAVDSASVLSCGLEATTNALISVFEHRTRFSEENRVKPLSELCLRSFAGLPAGSFSKAPLWMEDLLYRLF